MLLHKSVEFDSRVRREASALAEAGHAVMVLELARVPGGQEVLDGFLRRSCVPPDWVTRRLPSVVYRPLMLLWFVGGLMRARPQIVHAHDAAMLLPGTIGAWLTGARLVYDSHELATSVPYRERWWARFVGALEYAVLPRCVAVITVSDGIAARLRERYHLRITPTVVRNVSALQPSGTGGLRRRLGLARDAPLVLHQGAPAPMRGCDVLVNAVARLDGVHLVFLGDPEPGYSRELLAVIAGHGIGDRVSMLPSVPLAELLAYTAEADVGVSLLQDSCENHRLALPNKLFEYVAAGVPVIVGALPESQRLIAEYGIGWSVCPDDAEGLARALREAIDRRGDASLGLNLARAASELRWPREKWRLTDLYARLDGSDPDGSDP